MAKKTTSQSNSVKQAKSNRGTDSSALNNMVSVRMDIATREQLDSIGDEYNLKRSDIARAYLNLCETVVVKTNQELTLFDGTKLSLIPLNVFRSLFLELPSADKMEIGDRLGNIALTNCTMRNLQTWQAKLMFIHDLGWFEIKKITKHDNKGRSWMYYAIITHDLPLDMLHALLFRLIDGRKLPISLTTDDISKDNFRRMKRKNLDDNMKMFVEVLGSLEENFQKHTMMYQFDQLREELS